ncbi:MAG: hypothetical protein GX086_07795, partial [Alcaligenaceae bacterium]|nr:hypothetical protein [Alcaligenaceae bacterium]
MSAVTPKAPKKTPETSTLTPISGTMANLVVHDKERGNGRCEIQFGPPIGVGHQRIDPCREIALLYEKKQQKNGNEAEVRDEVAERRRPDQLAYARCDDSDHDVDR